MFLPFASGNNIPLAVIFIAMLLTELDFKPTMEKFKQKKLMEKKDGKN